MLQKNLTSARNFLDGHGHKRRNTPWDPSKDARAAKAAAKAAKAAAKASEESKSHTSKGMANKGDAPERIFEPTVSVRDNIVFYKGEILQIFYLAAALQLVEMEQLTSTGAEDTENYVKNTVGAIREMVWFCGLTRVVQTLCD